MTARHDSSDEWPDDEECSMDEEPPPTPGGYEVSARRPQHIQSNHRRPSENNRTVPLTSSSLSHESQESGTTRHRVSGGGSSKSQQPSILPTSPGTPGTPGTKSFQSKLQMFESRTISPSSHHRRPSDQAQSSASHNPPRASRKVSAPEERAPRKPTVMSNVQEPANRHAPMPPEHSPHDPRQIGRSRHHRGDCRNDIVHEDQIQDSLKRALEQRQSQLQANSQVDRPGSRTGHQPSRIPAHQSPLRPSQPRDDFEKYEEEKPPVRPPRGSTRPSVRERPQNLLPGTNPIGVHPLPQTKRSPTSPTAPAEKNSSQRKPWNHGKIDRTEAETRLRYKSEDGAFLVRKGKDEQTPYVLSLIHNQHMYHTLVRKKNGMLVPGISDKPNEMAFENIQQLVTYYQQNDLILMSKGPHHGVQCSTRLVVPADQPSPMR